MGTIFTILVMTQLGVEHTTYHSQDCHSATVALRCLKVLRQVFCVFSGTEEVLKTGCVFVCGGGKEGIRSCVSSLLTRLDFLDTPAAVFFCHHNETDEINTRNKTLGRPQTHSICPEFH